MFTDNEQLDHIYRGYNGDFVQRVWGKRRADERAMRLAEQERKHRETEELRAMGRLALQAMRAEIKDVREAEREAKREIRRQAKEAARRVAAEGIDVRDDVECVEQSVREIIEAVAVKAGVMYDDLVNSRAYKIIPLRHQAIVEVYTRKPSLSLTQIGRFFNKDHSTIHYAVTKAGVKRSAAT